MSDVFVTRFEGPSPVAQVGKDLVKRGVVIAPVLMVLGLIIWGNQGFWSVGYGVGLILSCALCTITMATESLTFYIGTYTGGKSRGIYYSTLNLQAGTLSKPTLAAETENPSFLIWAQVQPTVSQAWKSITPYWIKCSPVTCTLTASQSLRSMPFS